MILTHSVESISWTKCSTHKYKLGLIPIEFSGISVSLLHIQD